MNKTKKRMLINEPGNLLVPDEENGCTGLQETEGTPLVMSQAACFNRIRLLVDREGLSDKVIGTLRRDLDYLAKFYRVEDLALVLLAGILEATGARNGADDEDLARYLGCTNIEFYENKPLLRVLEYHGAIVRVNGRNRPCYRITPEVSRSVEEDKPFEPVPLTGLAPDALFNRIRKVFQDARCGNDDADRTLERLTTLLEGNRQLEFCRRTLETALFNQEGMFVESQRRIFLYLCHRYVSHGDTSVGVDLLMNLCDVLEDECFLKRRITCSATLMQSCGLVTFGNDDGMADSGQLSLSDEVRDSFFHEVEISTGDAVSYRDLVSASSITPRQLFYNEEESAQMRRLESLLEPETFASVQHRLEESGMRRGFNVLFYGTPGTGKTAGAYELARRSGRGLFVIDMSSLKSKWVGESEKNIKGVFTTYRKMCAAGGPAPILLFNEADAVFGRRIANVEHSVDQMNNTMQNIILQEMETLDGILIATTNLEGNLDPAFERRFIFKVKFSVPEAGARRDIWQSMLPSLSGDDAAVLAERYPFSGGNIENIARKGTVEYVLTGKRPTLDSLLPECDRETLQRQSVGRIGFGSGA